MSGFLRKWLILPLLFILMNCSLISCIDHDSIHAAQNAGLVDISTQVCGIDGSENYSMKITQQQYHQLQSFIVDFRAQMNTTKTTEETSSVFRHAVVELNAIGVLPRAMSVDEAQDLVAHNQDRSGIDFFEKGSQRTQRIAQGLNNILCYIAGETTGTFIYTPRNCLSLFVNLPLVVFFFILPILLIPFVSFLPLYFVLDIWEIAFQFAARIYQSLEFTALQQRVMTATGIWLRDSSGWMQTIGVLGRQTINGTFGGNFPGFLHGMFFNHVHGFKENEKAVIGFTGLRFLLDSDSAQSFYLGSAALVSVQSEG